MACIHSHLHLHHFTRYRMTLLLHVVLGSCTLDLDVYQTLSTPSVKNYILVTNSRSSCEPDVITYLTAGDLAQS